MSHERVYNHFKVNGEILLPDPKSAKAAYGLHCPEYLPSDHPDFLREGTATFKDSFTVYQLTEPTNPISYYYGHPVGAGIVIVEAQDCSGNYHECGIHESKIIWNDAITGQKKGETS